ncbi:MAG TPA: hypothetical protein VEX68_14640 [Bryobacteraceae bacterium]|nr:hypothetical protein [Bryobacteraceae bacterium]
MALIPNFDRIVATITASDIDKFMHSNAPEDDKQRVRDAGSDEIRMRLVGGYLIRTNQITTARLDPKIKKAKSSGKATKASKSPKAPAMGKLVGLTSA